MTGDLFVSTLVCQIYPPRKKVRQTCYFLYIVFQWYSRVFFAFFKALSLVEFFLINQVVFKTEGRTAFRLARKGPGRATGSAGCGFTEACWGFFDPQRLK